MIPFIDLERQQEEVKGEIDRAIARVLAHGKYIMGPEVFDLEAKLSEFCGAQHVVSCSNGTDAISLFLRAKNVGSKDAVIVPSFTFIATAEVVSLIGAHPIFVDVEEDGFNIDPQTISDACDLARGQGLNPVGVIAVDLFGRPANYKALRRACDAHDLWLFADSAQSFGATVGGESLFNLADAASTSFFPAKPLGCYGDGGAIFTNDDALAEILKSLRVHGKGSDKYDNVRIGYNARLDTIQAAILLQKLTIFPREIEARNVLASKYSAALDGRVQVPKIPDDMAPTWAQYTVRVNADDRDDIMRSLKQDGVPSVVYYPIPLHRQKAYAHYPALDCSVSDMLSREVLSLPMHGHMDDSISDTVIESVLRSTSEKG